VKAGGLENSDPILRDLDVLEEEFDEIDKAYRREELQRRWPIAACARGARRLNILRARSCRSPSTSPSRPTMSARVRAPDSPSAGQTNARYWKSGHVRTPSRDWLLSMRVRFITW
jgi:hypothetical protein